MKPLLAMLVVRNEASSLGLLLESLDQQTLPESEYDVLLVDGRSTDGTRAIAERWVAMRANANVVDNPGLTIAAGLNVALALSNHPFLAKLDAHCVIPQDYLRRGMEFLRERPEVMVVGGPMTAEAEGAWSGPIADAWNSSLASGTAAHRGGIGRLPASGVPVPLGMYRRELFERTGGIGETLGVAEDDGLFEECWQQFGSRSTWIIEDMRFQYLPRSSLWLLALQHFRYGRDKVKIWFHYRRRPGARHGVLLATSLVGLAVGGAALKRPRLMNGVLAGVGLWVGGLWGGTRYEGLMGKRQLKTCCALATMQSSYALGMWKGLLERASRSTRCSKGPRHAEST